MTHTGAECDISVTRFSRLKTFPNFLVVSVSVLENLVLRKKVLDISQNFGLSTQCTGVKLKSYTGVKSYTEIHLTSETPIPHFPFTCHSSIQGLEAHLGLGSELRLASNNTQLIVHHNSRLQVHGAQGQGTEESRPKSLVDTW